MKEDERAAGRSERSVHDRRVRTGIAIVKVLRHLTAYAL